MIPRVTLAPGLVVPRVLTGLWQVADLERDGEELDREAAAEALMAYAKAGFDGFDMADHYGSAELIAGVARQKLKALTGETPARFFTKWCPPPDQHGKSAVRAGIQERLDRLGTDRIDLLQLHWWNFAHPGWLDVLQELTALKAEGAIGAIGVTNVDTDHLHVALQEGFEIATNQVSYSVIDRRAGDDLSALCRERGVKLLAYGTLAGGFLSEKWLHQAEPSTPDDWSKMKYKRFIDSAGGWQPFQRLLSALKEVADRHGTSLSNVATRWVLDDEAVGCVIIGARLTEREHRTDTQSLFGFDLTNEDRAQLQAVFDIMQPIPGDCGREYRRPPFLTASGDLSHHLDSFPPVYAASEDARGRLSVSSGSIWEDICGFSRAVRVGDRILVSGTTATHPDGRAICPGDARGQMVYALDKIEAAITSLGGRLEDVVRTRVYLRDAATWEPVSRVHGRVFDGIAPANTLFGGVDLIGGYDVEVEAEAIVKA